MKKTKKLTIQDVAEHAGVSMMTVSRVLRQNGKVASDTREKVMKAVTELNYRPNIAARRLASERSCIIGLLYADPESGYGSKFLLGALKSCRQTGYHLVVETCDENVEAAVETARGLIEVTGVESMILLQPMADMPEVIALLKEYDMPFVRVAPDTDLSAAPYVCMDDYGAAFDMTNKLLDLGHSQIGFVIGHPNQGGARLRYQGYLDALRSRQILCPPEYIEQGYFDYKSGLQAAEKLLALPNRPSAIFASNDDMAAAVVAVAHRLHLEVPDELSVVGFDDTIIASRIWPRLTTVRQPIEEMADAAIALLTSEQPMRAGSAAELRHVLDFDLVLRESTAAPAATLKTAKSLTR